MADATVSTGKSLTASVVAGSSWSSLSTVGRQILTFGCVGILARLLDPGVYGLMAMANIVIVFLLNFRDLGTAAAVVQRPEVSQRLLSSLFWLNCGVGLTFSLVVFAASWPMAVFFHEPRLLTLLQALSLSFLITSVGVVHNAVLARRMAFRSIAVADIASGACSYAVAIAAAFAGLGVWSLVLASLTNSFVGTVCYWWMGGWTPKPEFDREEIRSIAKFSLNLSGFGLVNYFARNADNIVVGRFLGKAPLGLYQMAYTLMLYPIQNISGVLGQVLLPAFSRIQSDNARFREAYIRSCMLTGLITFPAILGMGVVADPLVRAILGAQWVPVIRLFQILTPVGLLQSIHTTVGHIYVAKGRTDLMLRVGLLCTVVFTATFLFGVRYGVTGVALAYCVSYLGIVIYPAFIAPFRLIELSLKEFALRLAPQMGISLCMAVFCECWLMVLDRMNVSSAWLRLISTSVAGGVFYIAAMVRIRPTVILCLEETVGNSENSFLCRCLRAVGLFRENARP